MYSELNIKPEARPNGAVSPQDSTVKRPRIHWPCGRSIFEANDPAEQSQAGRASEELTLETDSDLRVWERCRAVVERVREQDQMRAQRGELTVTSLEANRCLRILVADDEPDMLDLLRAWLEGDGYDVLAATDGEQALSMVLEQKPDLAVLDVRMPMLDGYEVTRKIRADKTIAETPIIMLSAAVEDEDVIFGFAAGADDYIKKPAYSELMKQVEAFVGQRSAVATWGVA